MNNVINKYLEYIRLDKNLSQNTIESYKLDLKKYIHYLNENDIDFLQVTENDIFTFLIHLEKNNASVSSISRKISSIKSFHEFLFLNKLSDNNPAKKLKKPRIERAKMDILTEEEVDLFLNSPDTNTTKGIRDKAILEMLYGTGIKVSELIQLNLDDINLDMEYISCKTNKGIRIIPLGSIAKQYIVKYLNDSRSKIVKDENQKALFLNSKGERFTRQGLWKIIKRYTEKLNLNKNVTPTMLRHSFAIHLLNKGANISVVGKILGNTNLSSLQGYLNHLNKNIRQEFKEKHPRG
ncbi:tyrosine-type recombinase/integrase [Tepidibacter formicigenes]|jgi:integrase/recombinase XerD|uniref:Integrase/recombinase XerD n=1 Tax=Tepidibacter formicigenes DSM 15518 TaxID=1123349 RepID=A0A1M6L138_9FIRM|nr:tyrosine-type recombinase/integrase [Tepidibacter formicigenes]SHJ64834.1 integrase/recombinase XerD [Tepidibacter formicigenes DSM 15518]